MMMRKKSPGRVKQARRRICRAADECAIIEQNVEWEQHEGRVDVCLGKPLRNKVTATGITRAAVFFYLPPRPERLRERTHSCWTSGGGGGDVANDLLSLRLKDGHYLSWDEYNVREQPRKTSLPCSSSSVVPLCVATVFLIFGTTFSLI